MSSLAVKWNKLQDAWEYNGIIGVWHLVSTRFLAPRMRMKVRKMRENRSLLDQEYDSWFKSGLPGEELRKLQHERVFHHSVSYLIPTYNTRPDLLRALADSFLEQTCADWEVCIYDGASSNPDTISMLKAISEEDERFHIVFGKENLGISGNTNKALVLANSDYVALCDHDDLLSPDCTYWLLDAAERGADFIYSDEDKTNEEGNYFFDPHFKPDFSPDALRSGNYICHIFCLKTDLMRSVSGLRPCCDGSQDHDLALRASEKAAAIAHIPRVLYHWRMLNTSYSHSSAERCANAAVRAVSDQLERLQLHGKASNYMLMPYIQYDIPSASNVSVIVHSLDGGFSVRWMTNLIKGVGIGSERLCEILVVGEKPEKTEIANVPVRYAKDLDDAAKQAQGSLLLFLEQGVYPLQPNWLERLMMFATRPWIACCGGGILDKNEDYLVCGYAVDVPDCAIPEFQGENRNGMTYQLYDRKVRETTAVSSVCMMIRKSVYLQLGGVSPYKSELGMVSLGIKAQMHGLSCVIVPEAICKVREKSILYGHFAPEDVRQFQQDYPNPVEHYYSPNFEKQTGAMYLDASVHRDPVTVITRFDA